MSSPARGLFIQIFIHIIYSNKFFAHKSLQGQICTKKFHDKNFGPSYVRFIYLLWKFLTKNSYYKFSKRLIQNKPNEYKVNKMSKKGELIIEIIDS